MKVAVLTYGSRGDVEPFVGVVRALRARGHDAWLAAPRGPDVPADVPCRWLAGDVRAMFAAPDLQRAIADGRGMDVVRLTLDWQGSFAAALDESVVAACEGADVIASFVALAGRGASIAERRGVPFVMLMLAPSLPTSAFPSPLVDRAVLDGVSSLATHEVVHDAYFRLTRVQIDNFRARLGLGPIGRPLLEQLARNRTPILSMHSPALVPRPSDWRAEWRVVGAARPGARALAPATDEFILEGASPFAVSFGSMPLAEGEAVLGMLHDAVAQVGARAVVSAGWSGLGARRLGPLLVVDDCCHASLLPRCVAMIHHGGAGTTIAALRAGLPSAVWSLYSDQHFWGAVLERRGLGLHNAFTGLGSEALASALRRLRDDHAMRARARAVAVSTADEDGAEAVARVLEGVSS